MSLLDHDALYWLVGVILAVTGLVKLAQRRHQQLTELLRTYVKENQKIAPPEDPKS